MFKNLLVKKTYKNAPKWLVLLIDIYIVCNTFILAYLIRFNFNLNFDISQFKTQLPLVILLALISFLITGSYKGIIRHTGARDSINVFFASFIVLISLIIVVLVNKNNNIITAFTIPKSIIVIHFLLNVITLIASRFLFKEIYRFLNSNIQIEKKALIYGAGQAGLLTYSALKNDGESKIQVLGFIDDDKLKYGKKINGIPVLDSNNIDGPYILKNNIDEIIISIQKIKPSRLLELVDKLTKLNVKVKIVPPVASWIDNSLQAKQIQQVRIEDLLGRAPIKLSNTVLQDEFKNKTILVTGAAGSIGSEIARQLASYDCNQLVLIDQAESDLYNLQQNFNHKAIKNIIAIVANVRNRNRIDSIIEKYQPEIIFHAAAYKHVPFMEENPYEAIHVNIKGTKIVADLALKHKVEKFVMVSTDKAVNPTNVMGATKRVAEMYINCLKGKGLTKYITTRFGNVLGSNGSVIPLFQSQIQNGGPLTVTHKDITRYFMTIPEACQLVLEAGTMGKGGEIFVFDMGKSIKIYDLALNMIHLSGLKFPEDINIKITGLRPGEKIYEELLGSGENTTSTHHDKIMIAKVKDIDVTLIQNKIEALCLSNQEQNILQSVLKIKEIVPEYISNNSVYEKLD